MKKITFVIIFIFISGCSALNKKQEGVWGEIQAHKQQLSKDPNNANSLASLGEHYYALFKSSNDSKYRDLSIEYNEAYLKVDPHHPKVQRSLYLAYFTKVSKAHSIKDEHRLKALYKMMTPINARRLSPPSLAVYLYLVERQPKVDELIEVLKDAIVEQPKNVHAYIKLAKLYQFKERDKMAMGVLMFASKHNSEYPYLQAALGDMYFDRGENKVCTGDQYGDLNSALTAYKKVLKTRPDDADLLSYMARAYFLNGHLRLALQKYKQSYKYANEDMDLLEIGSLYSILGKTDKAEEYFLKSEDEVYKNQDLAFLYFSQEKWKKSLGNFDAFFALKDDYFYGRLIHSYALGLNNENNNANAQLMQFAKKYPLDEWEESLYRFRLGELTPDNLNEQATDACKRTEAYFYQAMQARLNGNFTDYQLFLDKVLQEKIYKFVEYNIAVNLRRNQHDIK